MSLSESGGIVVATVRGVNQWIFYAAMLVQLGCHIGRPRPATSGVFVGRISVPSAEPGLSDSLRNRLGAALAAMGASRGSGGDRVDVEVQMATTRPMAVGVSAQIFMATLSIRVEVFGVRPRSTILSGERSFPVSHSDSLGASGARARAFDELTRSLSRDAASWIVYGPSSEQK